MIKTGTCMSINGGGGNSGHCQITFHYLNSDLSGIAAAAPQAIWSRKQKIIDLKLKYLNVEQQCFHSRIAGSHNIKMGMWMKVLN